MQTTLWGDAPIAFAPFAPRRMQLDDASVLLHQPAWLQGADRAFDEVRAAVHWRHERRTMYDRVVDVPRLMAAPAPSSTLDRIIGEVGESIGAPLEHIGLNLYRSGADSVAWHRDRIGDARDWSVIALVSLGGPRTLQVRRWLDPTAPGPTRRGSLRSITLYSGDLLIMAGACQRDWEHRVPKTRRAAPRISIACRTRQFPQGPLLQHAGVTPWRIDHKLQ